MFFGLAAALVSPSGLCFRFGMNLYSKLLERDAAGRPVTVGLIGAAIGIHWSLAGSAAVLLIALFGLRRFVTMRSAI